MTRVRKTKLALIFFLIAVGLTNVAFIKKSQTLGNLYFDSEDVRKGASYPKVLTYKGENIEQAKWQYLIDRVRKSSYMFVRNSETFGGAKAATHLLWKFSRKGKGVKTAKEFIYRIASESSMSGSPYLVKVSDKETYPLRDVMMNELRRLELYLEKDQLSPSEEKKGI